jgi:hypothetical protein
VELKIAADFPSEQRHSGALFFFAETPSAAVRVVIDAVFTP